MNIPPDKRMHWLAGLTLGGIAAALALIVGWSLFAASMCAIVVAVFAGLSKEIYDQFHPQNHTADKWDAVATALGGLTVVAVIAIMRWMRMLVILTLIGFGAASCATSPRVIHMPAADAKSVLKADESLRSRVERLTAERNKLADRIEADTEKLALTDKALNKATDDITRQRLRILSFVLFGIACIALVATLWLPVAKRLLSIVALCAASLGAAALILRALWPWFEPVCYGGGVIAVLAVIWQVRSHIFGLHEIVSDTNVDVSLLGKRARHAFDRVRNQARNAITQKLKTGGTP